jgi:uncharacterized Ntn-hydrolase superfamily protein
MAANARTLFTLFVAVAASSCLSAPSSPMPVGGASAASTAETEAGLTQAQLDAQEAAAHPSAAYDPNDASTWPPVATFSIIAYDSASGMWGGAVQSRVFSVGNGVLWAEADVGIVATQAVVDVSYGPQALELLRAGVPASDVVKIVWERDPNPDTANWNKTGRQFAVVDAKGRVGVYTGPTASTWAGHKTGKSVTAQGNILAGPAVVDSMIAAYEATAGQHMAFRLMAALDGGQKAGGDRRGMQSAMMIIVKKNAGVWLHNDVITRLQVDDSPQPLAEMRRLLEVQQRMGRLRVPTPGNE